MGYMALLHIFHFFFIREGAKTLFLRMYGQLDPKYTLDVYHSLENFHCLDFKNADFDDFPNFKTTFCKNCLIPGETETRNV